MARYLMTGASGLLGSHLISQLVQEHVVVSIGRSAPSHPIRHIDADLATPNFTELIDFVPDGIFHLAQSENYRRFPEAVSEVFAVNTLSTQKLLEFSAKNKVKKFLLASSGAVYGSALQPYIEEMPLPPKFCASNFYAASKLSAEALVLAYRSLFQVVICRYFFIYGPGQKSSMLIPSLIDKVKKEQTISMKGEHGLLLNPIYAEDAAHLTAKAMEHFESDLFNIAGPGVVSLETLVEMIGQIEGKVPVFSSAEGVPKNCVADIHKMKKILGAPKTSLHDGLVYLCASLEKSRDLKQVKS